MIRKKAENNYVFLISYPPIKEERQILDFMVGAGRIFSQQLIKGCHTRRRREREAGRNVTKAGLVIWPQPAWDSLTS